MNCYEHALENPDASLRVAAWVYIDEDTVVKTEIRLRGPQMRTIGGMVLTNGYKTEFDDAPHYVFSTYAGVEYIVEHNIFKEES